MKKLLAIVLALMLVFSLAACKGNGATDGNTPDETTTQKVETPANPIIRMSTTTSVDDSGLLGYLLPVFEKATGYTVEVQSAGTGIAIENAQNGNADLILVHAKASEEAFIADGYGVERIPFMYNYFVVVGPADDPAGIKDCANAGEAFRKIRDAEAEFISRGDESGTHKAELKIWADDVPDAENDKWYVSSGKKMGECLTMTSEKGAYCLTDKATFLSMADKLELEILLEKGDDMKNTYSVIECNPEKLDDINTEGAKAFIEWITGDEASALIAEYGKEEYGQALFYLLEE